MRQCESGLDATLQRPVSRPVLAPCLSAHAFHHFDTNLCQIGKKVRGPAVDVVLPHGMAHALHSLGLFLLRHFQCAVNGAGELSNVVGVHKHRVGQFVRSSSERAQEENSALILARRHELLGYEVHPIVERGHHAKGSGPIEASNLFMRMVFLAKNDRFPPRRLEAGVDAVRLRTHFVQEILVSLDEVSAEADRINTRFQTSRWKPIVFRKKHHSHEEIARFYRAASLCMVTSLHDGMNLVSKEFVASREDERGVLLLSTFAGAAHELSDAVLVNPYDIAQLARAIHRALEMPEQEQAER